MQLVLPQPLPTVAWMHLMNAEYYAALIGSLQQFTDASCRRCAHALLDAFRSAIHLDAARLCAQQWQLHLPAAVPGSQFHQPSDALLGPQQLLQHLTAALCASPDMFGCLRVSGGSPAQAIHADGMAAVPIELRRSARTQLRALPCGSRSLL